MQGLKTLVAIAALAGSFVSASSPDLQGDDDYSLELVDGLVLDAVDVAQDASSKAIVRRQITETVPINWTVPPLNTLPQDTGFFHTVAAGTTITWSWTGFHNVVQVNGSVRSGPVVLGGTFSHQFNVAERFTYMCELHSNSMVGAITVIDCDVASDNLMCTPEASSLCSVGDLGRADMSSNILAICPFLCGVCLSPATTTPALTGPRTTTTEVPPSVSPTSSPTPDPCLPILCAISCNGVCGWSRSQNLCVRNGNTAASELGLCRTDNPTAAPSTRPPTSQAPIFVIATTTTEVPSTTAAPVFVLATTTTEVPSTSSLIGAPCCANNSCVDILPQNLCDLVTGCMCQSENVRDACPIACQTCSTPLICETATTTTTSSTTTTTTSSTTTTTTTEDAPRCNGVLDPPNCHEWLDFGCPNVNDPVFGPLAADCPAHCPAFCQSSPPSFVPSVSPTSCRFNRECANDAICRVGLCVLCSEYDSNLDGPCPAKCNGCPTRSPTDVPSSLTPTHVPSAVPTILPSTFPTTAPTAFPSPRPSSVPSNAPSRMPTAPPTRAPTITPSLSPSAGPTMMPTVTPSLRPTQSPTSPPSPAPSSAPTGSPTSLPTLTPSQVPSGRPTFSPSVNPSAGPTQVPSRNPTSGPTQTPVAAPSSTPTALPTELPSRDPTESPSSQPTITPTTVAPSNSPTSEPSTSQPSLSPSASPTTAPTTQPSSHPTSLTPTDVPTLDPTGHPTTVPSASPTSSPTRIPTTAIPSHIPTLEPTHVPTAVPSLNPTGAPSAYPSERPSLAPTLEPSNPPTQIPSSSPVAAPTVVPSTNPSATPSYEPTEMPSAVPSMLPSDLPTIAPSSLPTATPTGQPSFTPTIRPSEAPSTRPSATPTSSPTATPSATPTFEPTQVPTTIPSASPTLIPTDTPTPVPSESPSTSPSKIPTSTPTASPTIAPSQIPTSVPTEKPSRTPTVSPSFDPTMQPSTSPSARPSTAPTINPTSLPTELPTPGPTMTPSAMPTATPTFFPSEQPSKQPTSVPSTLPTGAPTDRPSTATPSVSPSELPSNAPTSVPSNHPSITIGQPTPAPTARPTPWPTFQPTISGLFTIMTFLFPNADITLINQTSFVQKGEFEVCRRLPNIVACTEGPAPQGYVYGGSIILNITFLPLTIEQQIAQQLVDNVTNGDFLNILEGNTTFSSQKADVGFGTAAPTISPTSTPSARPTETPTLGPTSVPSSAPSERPSEIPSEIPTHSPTSPSPTLIPSDIPTSSPTAIPSTSPTSQPTSAPTAVPTENPSFQPTTSPSNQPSVAPSGQPTNIPSTVPSAQPTIHPTSPPTVSPTLNPTTLPTSPPSAVPTGDPSFSPTLPPSFAPSVSPTTSPSHLPSVIPTLTPTSNPTGMPTRSPSVFPTGNPSLSPSGHPTSTPTIVPSNSPTRVPSATPSAHPTSQPSVHPSNMPSERPTTVPTSLPSVFPTQVPSVSPTNIPTPHPSDAPTIQPSKHPSTAPSSQPSAIPSHFPTLRPTTSPSRSPSRQPSPLPTAIPSKGPTHSPSENPTSHPSIGPSKVPSSHPTATPTNLPSLAPSTSPSSAPTALPSRIPSETPTFAPSEQPTSNPTGEPTASPSSIPTHSPSRTPSSTPTELPSIEPTETPTHEPTVFPSIVPSAVPTQDPRASPTPSPTGTPTTHPSVAPIAPTGAPTDSPSAFPSFTPTQMPTVSPSPRPTVQPSTFPSTQPTKIPTVSPSSVPTLSPSLSPIAAPTAMPTELPTVSPSRTPSEVPTQRPSAQPTQAPTELPTLTPTAPTTSPTPVSCTGHLLGAVEFESTLVVESGSEDVVRTQIQEEATRILGANNASASVSYVIPSGRTDRPTFVLGTDMTDATIIADASRFLEIPLRVLGITLNGVTHLVSAWVDAERILSDCSVMAAPTFAPSAPTAAPTNTPTSGPTQRPTTLRPTTLSPTARPSTSPTSAAPSTSPTSLPSSLPTSMPTAIPTIQPSSTPTASPTSSPTAMPTALPSAIPTQDPTTNPTAGPTSSPTSGLSTIVALSDDVLVHEGDAAAHWWIPSEIYVAGLLLNYGAHVAYPQGAVLRVTTNDSTFIEVVANTSGTSARLRTRESPGASARVIQVYITVILVDNFTVMANATITLTGTRLLRTIGSPFPRYSGSENVSRSTISPIAGTANTTEIELRSLLELVDGSTQIYRGPLNVTYFTTNSTVFNAPRFEHGAWVARLGGSLDFNTLENESTTYGSSIGLPTLANLGLVVRVNTTAVVLRSLFNFTISEQLDHISLSCELSDGAYIAVLFSGAHLLYPGLITVQIEEHNDQLNMTAALGLLGSHSFAPQRLTVRAAFGSLAQIQINATVNFEVPKGGGDLGHRTGVAIPHVALEGSVFEVPVWVNFGGTTPGAVQMRISYDASVLQPFGVVAGSASNWTDEPMYTINDPVGRIRLGGIARAAGIRVQHEYLQVAVIKFRVLNAQPRVTVLYATVSALANSTCHAIEEVDSVATTAVPVHVGSVATRARRSVSKILSRRQTVEPCVVEPPSDVDHSCTLDVIDVCLANVYVSGDPLQLAANVSLMDVDKNGIVTSADVQLMNRLVFRSARYVSSFLATPNSSECDIRAEVRVLDDNGSPASNRSTRVYILAVPSESAEVHVNRVFNDAFGFAESLPVLLQPQPELYLASLVSPGVFTVRFSRSIQSGQYGLGLIIATVDAVGVIGQSRVIFYTEGSGVTASGFTGAYHVGVSDAGDSTAPWRFNGTSGFRYFHTIASSDLSESCALPQTTLSPTVEPQPTDISNVNGASSEDGNEQTDWRLWVIVCAILLGIVLIIVALILRQRRLHKGVFDVVGGTSTAQNANFTTQIPQYISTPAERSPQDYSQRPRIAMQSWTLDPKSPLKGTRSSPVAPVGASRSHRFLSNADMKAFTNQLVEVFEAAGQHAASENTTMSTRANQSLGEFLQRLDQERLAEVLKTHGQLSRFGINDGGQIDIDATLNLQHTDIVTLQKFVTAFGGDVALIVSYPGERKAAYNVTLQRKAPDVSMTWDDDWEGANLATEWDADGRPLKRPDSWNLDALRATPDVTAGLDESDADRAKITNDIWNFDEMAEDDVA